MRIKLQHSSSDQIVMRRPVFGQAHQRSIQTTYASGLKLK